jgi:ubiquinone/menaquinone biosynthesis C-methylase UbiE
VTTSAATHLGIRLDEYDARIRTFIPDYEVMISTAAQALATLIRGTPHIVDLGTGTGALASACLQAMPSAHLTLVDEDPGILDVARGRLATATERVTAVVGNFVDVPLPPCDAIVGSFTFHHVHDADLKRQVYRRLREALDQHGVFITVDCCPPAVPQLAAKGHTAWRDHLKQSYADDEADGYLAAWAKEDVYFSLPHELEMLTAAGLSPDVVWRRNLFAVITARWT